MNSLLLNQTKINYRYTWRYELEIVMILKNGALTATVTEEKIRKFWMETPTFFMCKFISALKKHKWRWDDTYDENCRRKTFAKMTVVKNRCQCFSVAFSFFLSFFSSELSNIVGFVFKCFWVVYVYTYWK